MRDAPVPFIFVALIVQKYGGTSVADPDRITPALVAALAADKAVFVVLHCNHPRELTAAARAACRGIIAAGVPVRAQIACGCREVPGDVRRRYRARVSPARCLTTP